MKSRSFMLVTLTLISAPRFCSAWGGQEIIFSMQMGALVRTRIASGCMSKHHLEYQATWQLRLNRFCINQNDQGGTLEGDVGGPHPDMRGFEIPLVYTTYKYSFIIFLMNLVIPTQSCRNMSHFLLWDSSFVSLKCPRNQHSFLLIAGFQDFGKFSIILLYHTI